MFYKFKIHLNNEHINLTISFKIKYNIFTGFPGREGVDGLPGKPGLDGSPGLTGKLDFLL